MLTRALLATVAACAAVALAPVPASAIVGGSPAAAGTFPSLAFITDDLGGGQDAYCTGTVVSANVILTAAHCLVTPDGTPEPASGFTVDTGTLDPSDDPAEASAVTALAVDPSFDAATDDSDAGVLVLATATAAPAVTLADDADAAALSNPVPITIAGWGLTSATATAEPAAARTADMSAQVAPYCKQNTDGNFDESTEFCAMVPGSNDVAVCNGDSGGPAFATFSGTVVEFGIIDRGANCDPTDPSIFTGVAQVAAWVNGEIANPPAAVTSTPAPAPTPPAASPAPVQVTPGAPAASVAPASLAPSPPSGGYSGKSAQRRGRVALMASAGAITRLRVAFNIQCGGAWLGPIKSTRTWTSGAPKLAAVRGGWSFEARYSAGGYRFAIAGELPARGSASGTLSVISHDPACRSGVVSWRAAPASA